MEIMKTSIKPSLKILSGIFLLCVLMFGTISADADIYKLPHTVTGNTDGLSVADIVNKQGGIQVRLPVPNPADDHSAPSPIGAKITIAQVRGVDLHTESGWQQAKSLTPEKAQAQGLENKITKTAGADGVINFMSLPIGLYLVSEEAPAGAGADYKVSLPFLITLPIGNPTGSAWDYYPVVNSKPAVEIVPKFSPININFTAHTCHIVNKNIADLAAQNPDLPAGSTFTIKAAANKVPAGLKISTAGKVAVDMRAGEVANGTYIIPVLVVTPNGESQLADLTVNIRGVEYCKAAPAQPAPKLGKTGAQILGIALAATGAILLGIFALRRKKADENSEESEKSKESEK